MKTKWVVIVLLSVVFGVVRFASAAEEHEHKEGEAKIPATISGIWAEVKEHEEQLGKIIADKKLDKVHEVAFEIRDLVNALPDKSMDLLDDKLAKVKSNVKYVADIAKRLDESGDAGDQVVTEANFKKLQDFLKTIEAQYLPEKLKYEEKNEHKE
ncbi:MAG: transporter [Candidatus Omnitrophica bacterium]|nr:transporter [Candidatus Omnitrophota bacterium]